MRGMGMLAACVLLTGCGGGGIASAGSTPVPSTGGSPTPTPTATNTTIDNLAVSQTFTSEVGTSTVAFEPTSGNTLRSAGGRSTVQVSYDAASRNYTIQTQGRSAVFSPADATTVSAGEAHYGHVSGDQRDYLTLVTTPYYNTTGSPNHYVGLGYWQRNLLSGNEQDTTLDTFVYGLESSAAAIPRSGSASWTTDIFGLLTSPGTRPRTTQGAGTFTADFAAGAFSTTANLDEYDFINGDGTVGSLRLIGSGSIGSGNGFSGNFSYNGSIAVNGTIAGKFYGPGAEEVGASFSATNSSGGALTGAMTGQRSAVPATSLSLTNLTTIERLLSAVAGLDIATKNGGPGFFQVSATVGGTGFVTVSPDGSHIIDMGRSDLPGVTLASADQNGTPRTNYSVFDETVAGTPVHVELYRPGPTNSELALTYVGFGSWRSASSDAIVDGTITRDRQLYFLYGFETPRDLLTGRTGTGRYDGIVAASGASMDGHSYAVGGTSRFDVDFGQQRYNGALALSGREAGGTLRDFGSWTFASTLGYGQFAAANIDNTWAPGLYTIQPKFFGPDGEEIGATFKLRTGPNGDPSAVDIAGLTVAKRR